MTINRGDFDYWIVKLDSVGKKVWQESFGGSGTDYALSVRENQRGYIDVAGNSNSLDGEVGSSIDGDRYWVLRLKYASNGAYDCGVERWDVKTLSDGDTSLIDFSTIVPSSVTEQSQMPRQSIGQTDPRYATERTVYKINGLLTDFKREADDHDLHLVIHDALTDSVMIIEIPDSACSAVASTSRGHLFAIARQWVHDNVGNPTTAFKTLSPPQPITITGVGFWDFAHGQRGLAANAREIHPVLTIEDWTGNAVAETSSPDDFTIDVFPNPTQRNILTVSLQSKHDIGIVAVSVVDVAGRVVVPRKSHQLYEGGNTMSVYVDTAKLAAGNYFVKIVAGGRLMKKMFVVGK